MDSVFQDPPEDETLQKGLAIMQAIEAKEEKTNIPKGGKTPKGTGDKPKDTQ